MVSSRINKLLFSLPIIILCCLVLIFYVPVKKRWRASEEQRRFVFLSEFLPVAHLKDISDKDIIDFANSSRSLPVTADQAWSGHMSSGIMSFGCAATWQDLKNSYSSTYASLGLVRETAEYFEYEDSAKKLRRVLKCSYFKSWEVLSEFQYSFRFDLDKLMGTTTVIGIFEKKPITSSTVAQLAWYLWGGSLRDGRCLLPLCKILPGIATETDRFYVYTMNMVQKFAPAERYGGIDAEAHCDHDFNFELWRGTIFVDKESSTTSLFVERPKLSDPGMCSVEYPEGTIPVGSSREQ